MILFSVKTLCRKKKNVNGAVYIKKEANCSRIKEMLNEFADSFMGNLNQLSVNVMWDTFERKRVVSSQILAITDLYH